MTDRSEASLPSAILNRHPHLPPVPHATSSSAPTFAPLWQQHLPQYPPTQTQAWQPDPQPRKSGLDTVIDAVCGPARRPEREWAFVRPHVSKQKPRRNRASSEETVDIPRPFPIPNGKRSSTRKASAAEQPDESPHHGRNGRPRPTSPPPRRREYHVRDRRRRSSLGAQLDGPASSDNNSRRDRSKTVWKDVTRTYSYKHFCAMCGRSRSASYHKEHPWGPGIRAKAGACRRCMPSRPWEHEPSDPSELCTPPPLREEIISESESEMIMVRHSANKKQAKSIKTVKSSKVRSRKDSMSPARSSKSKAVNQRPGTLDSLTTFAAESVCGTGHQDDESHPRIVRRLVYRYVPDLERMELRRARNNKTEIIIEEMPPGPHHPHQSIETGSNTAQVLASRPGAWCRGRMIQVDQDIEEESVTSSSSEEEKTKVVEEPEWYFRRVTRRTAPFHIRDDHNRPQPSRRMDATRYDEDMRQDSNMRTARRPIRSILQPSGPPSHRGRQVDDDWEDEDYSYYNDQQSRVSFAPGTKQGRRSTAVPCTQAPAQARKVQQLGQEALRDSVEAEEDRREERRIKSRARHEMAKDGGAYMELDGHYSDDQEYNKAVNEDDARPGPFPVKVSFASASTTRSTSHPTMPLSQSRPPAPRSISHDINITRQTPRFTCPSLFADDPILFTGFPTKVRQAQASIFSSRSNSRESSSETVAQSRSPRPALRTRRLSYGLFPVEHHRQQQTSPAPPESSPASPPQDPSPSRPQLSRVRPLSGRRSSEGRQRSMSPGRRSPHWREPSSPRLGRLSFTPPGSPLPRSTFDDMVWAQSTLVEEKDVRALSGKEEMTNVGRPRVKRAMSQRSSSTGMRQVEDGVEEELPPLPESPVSSRMSL